MSPELSDMIHKFSVSGKMNSEKEAALRIATLATEIPRRSFGGNPVRELVHASNGLLEYASRIMAAERESLAAAKMDRAKIPGFGCEDQTPLASALIVAFNLIEHDQNNANAWGYDALATIMAHMDPRGSFFETVSKGICDIIKEVPFPTRRFDQAPPALLGENNDIKF